MKLKNNCEDFRKNMHKLWQEDQCCDVILTNGDDKTIILAHWLVLAASSSYFANKIGKMKKIVVTEIDGDILQRLVEVCYSGILEVDEENMSKLYMGAMHLQLNSVLDTMDSYIVTQLNNSNCLQIYHLAETCSRSVLLDATKNYISEHFIEIGDQPSFLELSATKLKGLLTLEALQLQSVEELFDVIIKWVQHDPTGQRNFVLSELLPNLRLSSMSPKFLLECVKPHCKTVEAKDLILATLQTQLKYNTLTPTNVEQAKLIVVRGSDQKCEIIEYSTERQMWIILAELPTALKYLSVTHSKALNSLCFVGGCLEGLSVRDVFLWNLKTRIFSKLKSMKRTRINPGVISLNDDSDENGDLIVVGGWARNSLSTVERWSRKLGEWHSLLSTKEIRSGTRLAIVGNLMYCIGGLGKARLKSVECYDLSEKKSYTSRAPLQHARQSFGILVDGRKIYVIGGYTNVIECYDSEANKWTQVCVVQDSKEVKAVVRHNNGLIAFGNNIILTSDGDWKTWKRTLNIEAVDGYIYGAFSIPLQ